MMQLVRRRADADPEWAEINRLLGVQNPAQPRNFADQLRRGRRRRSTSRRTACRRSDSVDELYAFRGEDPTSATYIDPEAGRDRLHQVQSR
jgi:hypothetical protein